MYSLLKAGLEGPLTEGIRQQERYLPDNIYTAIDNFRNGKASIQVFGEDTVAKYADLKQGSADRCPRLLGSLIKTGEIQFHHEVYNQALWSRF